jgi:dTDP-4-amino-4,6-dideoxygalactose transaminase
MDAINEIAERHNLIVIEDAAQALGSTYFGRSAGTLAHIAAFSFHDTKNYVAGEGGALVLNDRSFARRAMILAEKGTNRTEFRLGLVDKYSWVDVGSSFRPSELTAAMLRAQLEALDRITDDRLASWARYHSHFAELEDDGLLRRPVVPEHCTHNAHIYFVILPDRQTRDQTLKALTQMGVSATFHYVPLHKAPAGVRFGRTSGSLDRTNDLSSRLLRMPMWYEMGDLVDRCAYTLKREVAAATV